MRKIWICLNHVFWSNQLKGININKKCFSPQIEPNTAKLCLSVVLKHFWGNSWRTFLFRHKIDYLRNEDWNTQKVCFSYQFWKEKYWWKIGFLYTTVFDQSSKRRHILTKTVFLHKVSHIQLNCAFLWFWSIFVEIHRELFFLDIKVTISETSTEIFR